jgi:hypothetical protein
MSGRLSSRLNELKFPKISGFLPLSGWVVLGFGGRKFGG